VQDVAAVEVDEPCLRLERRDRARDEDLRTQPPRLLQGARGQLVARDAGRKPEVVLDSGGRACLTAGRLTLDDDRAQSLRRTVDRSSQPGWAAPDHDHVVLEAVRARVQAE